MAAAAALQPLWQRRRGPTPRSRAGAGQGRVPVPVPVPVLAQGPRVAQGRLPRCRTCCMLWVRRCAVLVERGQGKAAPQPRLLPLPAAAGEGGFGKVYYGEWRGLAVAIKLLAPDACMRANVVEEFSREVSVEGEGGGQGGRGGAWAGLDGLGPGLGRAWAGAWAGLGPGLGRAAAAAAPPAGITWPAAARRHAAGSVAALPLTRRCTPPRPPPPGAHHVGAAAAPERGQAAGLLHRAAAPGAGHRVLRARLAVRAAALALHLPHLAPDHLHVPGRGARHGAPAPLPRAAPGPQERQPAGGRQPDGQGARLGRGLWGSGVGAALRCLPPDRQAAQGAAPRSGCDCPPAPTFPTSPAPPPLLACRWPTLG
jgi:hypothetical protein